MGQVRCGRHGNQTGPLVCDHILCKLNHPAPAKGPPVEFVIDIADDGTVLVAAAICEDCARNVPASPGAVIPGPRSEQPDFTRIVPVCGRCFDEYRARLSR